MVDVCPQAMDATRLPPMPETTFFGLGALAVDPVPIWPQEF
jgi:hypothetical protein